MTDPSVSTAGSFRVRARRLGHALSPEGERHGHHGRQRLGDGRHGQAHRGQEHQLDRLPAGDPGHEDDGADDEGCGSETLAERREPALEWRGASIMGLEQVGDPSQGRRHARRHDDPGTPPVGHRGALEGHVPLIGHERVRDVGKGRDDLGGGLRLAGQRSLVDSEGGRFGEPHVGRNDVAGLETDDITGHQLAGRNLCNLTTPHDASGRARHLLERGHRLLGAVVLDEPDHAVEQHDGENDEGVLEVADERCDDRRDHEHDDHRVRELLDEQAPGRLAPALDQLVRSEPGQSLGGVGHSQSQRRIGGQRRGDGRPIDRPRTGRRRGLIAGGSGHAADLCRRSAVMSGLQPCARNEDVRQWMCD